MLRTVLTLVTALAVTTAGCARPSSAPAQPLRCETRAPLAERQVALEKALAPYLAGKTAAEAVAGAQEAFGWCTRLAPLGKAEALVAQGPPADGGTPAAVAWKHGSAWHVVPVTGADLYLSGGSIAFPAPDQPDVFLVEESGGSGGFARLLHGQMAAGSRSIRLKQVKDLVEQANYIFLEHTLILLTYRKGIPEHAAWNCNACWPANDQTLFRWDDGRLTALGSRVLPEPYLTATLFLGALRDGRNDLALRYVSDPALLWQARETLGIKQKGEPLRWGAAQEDMYGDTRWRIRDQEKRSWDLLPRAHRTALPQQLSHYDFHLQVGSDRAVLRMERRPPGWIITSIRLTGRKAP